MYVCNIIFLMNHVVLVILLESLRFARERAKTQRIDTVDPAVDRSSIINYFQTDGVGWG